MTDLCIRCEENPRYLLRLVCAKCIAAKHRENRIKENGGIARPKGRPSKLQQKRDENLEKGWAELAPAMSWNIGLACSFLSRPLLRSSP